MKYLSTLQVPQPVSKSGTYNAVQASGSQITRAPALGFNTSPILSYRKDTDRETGLPIAWGTRANGTTSKVFLDVNGHFINSTMPITL